MSKLIIEIKKNMFFGFFLLSKSVKTFFFNLLIYLVFLPTLPTFAFYYFFFNI